MDPIQLASAFLNKQSSASSPSYTNITRATATSNSKDGYVMVDYGGMTVSDDGEQSVLLPTTVVVLEGDVVEVSLTGYRGQARTAVVTGVIGGGDRTNQLVTDAQSAANNARIDASAALDMAEEASGLANAAQESASTAHDLAVEAKGIADGVSEQVGQALADSQTALSNATDALTAANTANSTATEAKQIADSIAVTTYLYKVTETDGAPSTDDTGWTSTPVPFSNYLTMDAYQWVTIRTALGDGTVEYTEPEPEASFAADKAEWASLFTDTRMWALVNRGDIPEDGTTWTSTKPTSIPDGSVLWACVERAYNSGNVEHIMQQPYSGVVSQTMFYWQTLGDEPSQPTAFEPDGWLTTPPPVGEDVEETDSVFSCTRSVYGDGSFKWGPVEQDAFYTSYVNNVYALQSIKGGSGIDIDYQSIVEQTASQVMTSVSQNYVGKGSSGVDSLESVIVQGADNVTFGFISTVDATSTATNMVFDADGMTFVVGGARKANYGETVTIGEANRNRVSISGDGVQLFGDVDNPSTPTAGVEGSSLWAKNARVDDYLIMGNWRFYERGNGNMTLKWVG